MNKDLPPNLGPLGDVLTMVSAFTDAMNLRHLREELYEESVDLAPPRSSNLQVARHAAPFDPRLAYIGLQRAYVDPPVQYPRAKIDVGA